MEQVAIYIKSLKKVLGARIQGKKSYTHENLARRKVWSLGMGIRIQQKICQRISSL